MSGFLAAGGLAGALAAMSCCILPLALFGAGVSGAWIGNLTALAPLQPYFAGFALVCLAAGLWSAYGRRRTAGACRPVAPLATRVGLWAAAVMILAALAFPYVTPLFLGA